MPIGDIKIPSNRIIDDLSCLDNQNNIHDNFVWETNPKIANLRETKKTNVYSILEPTFIDITFDISDTVDDFLFKINELFKNKFLKKWLNCVQTHSHLNDLMSLSNDIWNYIDYHLQELNDLPKFTFDHFIDNFYSIIDFIRNMSTEDKVLNNVLNKEWNVEWNKILNIDSISHTFTILSSSLYKRYEKLTKDNQTLVCDTFFNKVPVNDNDNKVDNCKVDTPIKENFIIDWNNHWKVKEINWEFIRNRDELKYQNEVQKINDMCITLVNNDNIWLNLSQLFEIESIITEIYKNISDIIINNGKSIWVRVWTLRNIKKTASIALPKIKQEIKHKIINDINFSEDNAIYILNDLQEMSFDWLLKTPSLFNLFVIEFRNVSKYILNNKESLKLCDAKKLKMLNFVIFELFFKIDKMKKEVDPKSKIWANARIFLKGRLAKEFNIKEQLDKKESISLN